MYAICGPAKGMEYDGLCLEELTAADRRQDILTENASPHTNCASVKLLSFTFAEVK